MRKSFLVLAILSIATCCNTWAVADIAYSNYGPGDSYNSGSGLGFGNLTDIEPQATNYHLARGFTSEATGQLSSIELPLSYLPVFSNSMPGIATVSLWSQQAGGTPVGKPGQVLWTGESELVSNMGLDFLIYEINAGQNAPTLQTGTRYWVVASAKDGEVPLLWAQNDDPFQTGPFGFSFSDDIEWLGESSTTEPAFRVNVNVTSVPEPASSFGAIACCLAMVLRRRKR